MSDRLKQIWGKFEGLTERPLYGGGVDNIRRPQREFRQREVQETVSGGGEPPSKSAIAALKTAMSADANTGNRRQRGARRISDEDLTGRYAASLGAGAALLAPEGEIDGTVRDFRHDVEATARRIVRHEPNYKAYMSNRARAELTKPRKKFLGIF